MLSEREKLIGKRLRRFREGLRIPRTVFAASIGIGNERLGSYEAGRARLPYWVFQAATKRYALSPFWLVHEWGEPDLFAPFDDSKFSSRLGKRALFSEVFDRYIARVCSSAERAVARDHWHWVQFNLAKYVDYLCSDHATKDEIEEFGNLLDRAKAEVRAEEEIRLLKKQANNPQELTVSADGDKVGGVKVTADSPLPKLMHRVRAVIRKKGHGSRAVLAEQIGVSRQAVSKWLKGKGASLPSGDVALRLKKWVEGEEAKLSKES